MTLVKKLAVLADAAKYDASCASSGSKGQRSVTGKGLGSTQGSGICHSYTPDGRCISLLKILLTNYCIYDCKYCVNRVSSEVERARFTVAEVVGLTLDFYRRNYIEGLFLSSGIIRNSDYTMEQLVEVARRLRRDHHFNGYIHLKTIPGADDALITAAGRYADRLSVNIELATEADLRALAPEKKRPLLERNMSVIEQHAAEQTEDRRRGLSAPPFVPAGQSTQMIVGATPAPDRAILLTASGLYQRFRLRRVYYSAFSPIPHADARLPLQNPPLIREHRLYQADWLLRFYGFGVQEIAPETHPELDLRVDPKVAWALRNRAYFPLDVNKAAREQLLRIPGIGARSVERMLQIRRHRRLRLQDLSKLRIALNRARPFIITADYRPATPLTDSQQLEQQLITASAPQAQQLSLPL
jgi:putative DNA modification/repair radical SAM protein